MAAPNGNFQNDEEEYEFVLNSYFLFDAVLDAFGEEPISEYGSYRQVNVWMRTNILTWLRRQDFYWNEIYGINEEEEEEDEDDEDIENEQEAVSEVVQQGEIMQEGHIVQQNQVEEEFQSEVMQQSEVVQQTEEDDKNEVEQQVNNATRFENLYNLENRISRLENLFQQLKPNKKSKGESSRTKK